MMIRKKSKIWLLLFYCSTCTWFSIVRADTFNYTVQDMELNRSRFLWAGIPGDLGGTGYASCSSEQAHSGRYSIRFDYDFTGFSRPVPANVYANLVFRGPDLLGEPESFSIWVYGDGSFRSLVYRFMDATSRVWQGSLGMMNFTGWQKKTGLFDVNLSHWGGGSTPDDHFEYPLTFGGLIVSGGLSISPQTSHIYVDDLTVQTQLNEAEGIHLSLIDGDWGCAVGTGNEPNLVARLINFGVQDKDIELKVDVKDYHGYYQNSSTNTVTVPAGTEVPVNLGVTLPGRGYFEVNATASWSGLSSSQKISLGSIPPAPNEVEPNSPFAIVAGGYFEALKRLGVSMTRTGIRWFDTHRLTCNGYYWADWDYRFQEAADNNILVHPIIGRREQDFQTGCGSLSSVFLEDVNRTTLRNTSIKYWDLWNEPDYTWSGSKSDFGLMCYNAYQVIKANNPQMLVSYPSTSNADFDTGLNNFLIPSLAGIGSFPFDILTIHPYTRPNSPESKNFVNKLLNIKSWMASNAPQAKLWINECGFTTSNEPVYGCSEELQAAYLTRMYVLSLSVGIEKIFWYAASSGNDPDEGEANYGLFRYRWDPKPAAVAYAQLTHQLRNSVYKREISIPGGRGYCFENSSRAVAVVWSLTGNKQFTASWPAGTEFEHFDGATVKPMQTQGFLTLGELPVYITAPIDKAQELYTALANPLAFAATYNDSLNAAYVLYAGAGATSIGSPGFAVDTAIYRYGGGSLDASSSGDAAVKYEAANFPMTGSGTVEMWIRPNWDGNSLGENTFFHAHGTDTFWAKNDIKIYRKDNELIFYMFFDSAYHFKSVSANIENWKAGQWHYVAACWEGLDNGANTFGLSLYIDGVRVPYNYTFTGETMLNGMGNAVVGGNLEGVVSGAVTGKTPQDPHYNADSYIDALKFTPAQIYHGSSHEIPVELLARISDCKSVWDFGFGLAGDLNKDCYVNFADIFSFASQWLSSNSESE